MNGTNVVMKGPPWIPSIHATVPCSATAPCSTFSDQDALLLRRKGFTLIRLGVIWAGAQPTPQTDRLDPAWVARLHDILALCERHGIRAILDIHQDAVGTAMCGEGIPMWYSQKHFPYLIGKPLVGPKSSLTGNCSGFDAEAWALHAGDPLYNMRNPCCVSGTLPPSAAS